jgi:hypothetical protein
MVYNYFLLHGTLLFVWSSVLNLTFSWISPSIFLYTIFYSRKNWHHLMDGKRHLQVLILYGQLHPSTSRYAPQYFFLAVIPRISSMTNHYTCFLHSYPSLLSETSMSVTVNRAKTNQAESSISDPFDVIFSRVGDFAGYPIPMPSNDWLPELSWSFSSSISPWYQWPPSLYL